jgi:excinuclease ABC subunit C
MTQLAERQKMASTGDDDVDIFGYHREESMVAVSVFHMRGGRIVDRREMFWEDQDNFDPGEFIGSVVKQYYLDAPFIPAEIHVPAEFEDLELLEESLSQRKTTGRVMHEFKHGELKSGPSGKGGKVKSRKQAIAIGLSEARRSGAKVPKKPRSRSRKKD